MINNISEISAEARTDYRSWVHSLERKQSIHTSADIGLMEIKEHGPSIVRRNECPKVLGTIHIQDLHG